MYKVSKIAFAVSFAFSLPALGGSFSLQSNDIAQGLLMDKKQEFQGFGCSGGNQSPHLRWSNVPKGTKSFAITVHDADAPTGSGWWHWQVINIPLNVNELAANAGRLDKNLLPVGSIQIENDYGVKAFGGACPPEGHGLHHYRFTVHALSVKHIELPVNASGALTGYMINANTIASDTIESLYKR